MRFLNGYGLLLYESRYLEFQSWTIPVDNSVNQWTCNCTWFIRMGQVIQVSSKINYKLKRSLYMMLMATSKINFQIVPPQRIHHPSSLIFLVSPSSRHCRVHIHPHRQKNPIISLSVTLPQVAYFYMLFILLST